MAFSQKEIDDGNSTNSSVKPITHSSGDAAVQKKSAIDNVANTIHTDSEGDVRTSGENFQLNKSPNNT